MFSFKFFLSFEISNSEDLEDGWRERWVQGLPVRKRYLPDSGSYTYFRDDWKFRITSERVFVHLEEIRGRDPSHLKNKALVESFEAIRWLEENSPVCCIREPVETEIWTSQAEMGKIGHPFGMLVDRYSDMSLSDVKVYDSQGNERYKFDKSHGPAEIECVDRENHETDIEAEVSRLQDQAERPSRHKRVYEDLPDEMDEVKAENKELKEKVSQLVDVVEKISDNQDQVIDQVKENQENISEVVELENDRVSQNGRQARSEKAVKQEARGVNLETPSPEGPDVATSTSFSGRTPKTVRLGRCYVCGNLGPVSRDGHVETLNCETCDKEFLRVLSS